MAKKAKKCIFKDRDDVLQDYRCSFVTASAEIEPNQSEKCVKDSFDVKMSGEQVKAFYEELISNEDNAPEPSGKEKSRKTDENQIIARIKIEPDEEQTCSFTDPVLARRLVNQLLSAAGSGSKSRLKVAVQAIRARSDFHALLNGSDSFGWTALMCAAAEGHLNIVRYLVKQGCVYRDIVDNAGIDVFAICEQKEQYEVYIYLAEADRKPQPQCNVSAQEDLTQTIKCELCNMEILMADRPEHEASVMHIFNDKSKTTKNVYSVPESNRGFQMMLRNGWTADRGLGPEGTGRKNPVKTVNKQNRYGLGLVDTQKRVNHFSAHDTQAVKRSCVEKKQTSVRSYERKKRKDKQWEQDLRRYMSTDY